MKLYDYFRSTACYRVRIALNIKKVSYETLSVHLINHGGEQHLPRYLEKNPQGLVPTLEENGHVLTQSLAIMEYLDEIITEPPLLPKTPLGRAKVRSMALAVACDMHPLNNLRVLNQLQTQFGADENAITEWYHHWLQLGFGAIETTLNQDDHKYPFCYGNQLTLADICLIPQVYNAKRFGFSMADYPAIMRIHAHCLTIPEVIEASPATP